MRDGRRWRRRAGWLAVLALLLLAGFTRGTADTPRLMPAEPEPTFAETDASFPSDTASDVVSYADYVAIVTAVSEAVVASAPPDRAAQGESIARRITFRVDRMLWSRRDASAPPKTLVALWWGWLVRDGKRMPFAVHGTPWVVVGAQYVMPIALDRDSFTPIQPFAVFRLHRGVVMLEKQDTPLARQLANASFSTVGAAYANAVPHPVALRYRHLPPRVRLAAVLAARVE